MKRAYLVIAVALVTAGTVVIGSMQSLTAHEEEREFRAGLESYQETPLTLSTNGHGRLRSRLVGGDRLEVELTYANLEGGPATASHLHLGRRALSGGIIVHLCGTGGRPACPAGNTSTPAEVKLTIMAGDVVGPSAQGITAGEFAELVRALRNGAAYANVHNATYPAGEIRGQIHDHDR